MDRRQFVERSLGAGLLWTAGACTPTDAREAPETAAAGAPGGMRDDPGAAPSWGLQLYTVRSLMSRGVERTLAEVAEIGYGEVEFAGYFDRSPQQIRESLEAAGLEAPAAHVQLGALRGDLDGLLEASSIVGHRYLVLPFLDPGDRPDLDGYRRLAGEMNGFGERCAAAGTRFAYHNHDFELRPIEGIRPLDVLIEETDPSLVGFELDLFWLVHGGGDPFDYFSRHPGRFELCHVKDRTASGEMVDVGAGAIDFEAIFARSDEAGLIHYFVEHDQPGDPLGSIRASFDHLASLRT